MSLSPARLRLLELMQRVNFGRIEKLRVREGEPVFDPAPRVVRQLRMDGENGPRRESSLRDFTLKKETVTFCRYLDEIGTGSICCIQIKHGLPFNMEVDSTS